MKLTICKWCQKSYPKAAMENKDFCSKECISKFEIWKKELAKVKNL